MLKSFDNKADMSDYGINLFRAECDAKGLQNQLEIMRALVALVAQKNIGYNQKDFKLFCRSRLNKSGLKANKRIRVGAFYQLAAKGFIK
jgi:hypothetical protein